jgi:hypothetical protein
MHKNRVLDAYRVWKRIRGVETLESREEFFVMKCSVAEEEDEVSKKRSRFAWMDFFVVGRCRRAIIYANIMVFLGQFTGVNAIMYYMSVLIVEKWSRISPALPALPALPVNEPYSLSVCSTHTQKFSFSYLFFRLDRFHNSSLLLNRPTLMNQTGFDAADSNYMSLVGGGALLLGTNPAIFLMETYGRRFWAIRCSLASSSA